MTVWPTEEEWYDDHTDDCAPAKGIARAILISTLITGAIWLIICHSVLG